MSETPERNVFIIGQDIVESDVDKAKRELREANILNWRTEDLSNGSTIIIFEGELLEGSFDIVRRNGFRRRV